MVATPHGNSPPDLLAYWWYDIDRIASRTVADVALSLALVTVYAAGAVPLGTTVPAITGSTSHGPIVGLPIFTAVTLLQLVRRPTPRIVDGGINLSRYGAQQYFDEFARRSRNEVDLGALSDESGVGTHAIVQPSVVVLSLPKEA